MPPAIRPVVLTPFFSTREENVRNLLEVYKVMCVKRMSIQWTSVLILIFYCCLVNNLVIAGEDKVVVEKDAVGITIKSTGIGYPPEEKKDLSQGRLLARRAATVVAQRNLVKALCGSKKTGNTEIISGSVSGARVTSSKERADGSFEVELTLSMESSS